jgi:hypothetical protein
MSDLTELYRMLSGYAVKTTAIVALYLYMYLENKKRDRAALEGPDSEGDGVENGMLVSFPSGGTLYLYGSH